MVKVNLSGCSSFVNDAAYKENVDKALKIRLKALKNVGIIKTVAVGKKDILIARGRVQGEIARSTNPDKELFRAVSTY